MIDLLRDEVNRNFPERRKTDEYFTLHCSPSFAAGVLREFESFRDSHFFIADREDEPVHLSQFFVPNLGHVNIIEDMLQGYRLECVSCVTPPPRAALPPYITILAEFPHLSNSYCVDNNLFTKGETLMSGRERYIILSGPEEYKTDEGECWVYTLDKAVPQPIGKRLMKENFK